MKKTLKKLAIIFLSALALSLLVQSSVIALNMDDYKPENAAFSEFNFDKANSGESTEEATSATIFILQIFAGALLYFAAPVATILIAVNAFRMVFGGAESDSLDQSKKGLTWTILGLIVIILSYSIVRITISLSLQAAGNSS